jgi:large subunit ribosomal protein L35
VEAGGPFLFDGPVGGVAAGSRPGDTTGAGAMPKMKTHKGSKKRFRITAKGKLKRAQAGKKHLLSGKTGKRKRHLREMIIETDRMARKYIHVIGGDA